MTEAIQSAEPAEEANRTRRRFVFLLVVVAVVIGGIVWNSNRNSTPAAPIVHDVVFKVTGSAKQANLTLTTSTGGTSQQTGVDVPVTRKTDGGQGIRLSVGRGAFLYISAQNPNDDNGSLTCVIEEDGVEVARNTSSGSFTIVTCSTRA